MNHWARRLALPAALGVALRWRREAADLAFEPYVQAKWPDVARGLDGLAGKALFLAVEAMARAARRRAGGWKKPFFGQSHLRTLTLQIEEWLADHAPTACGELERELAMLESAVADGGIPTIGATGAFRAMAMLPDQGAQAGLDLEALDRACAAELGALVAQKAGGGPRLADPAAQRILAKAFLAAMALGVAGDPALKAVDLRATDAWHGDGEAILGRLRADLEAAERAFQDGAAEAPLDLGLLAARLRWAEGALALLGGVEEKHGERRTQALEILKDELRDRLRVLRELEASRKTPRPTTVTVALAPSEPSAVVAPPAADWRRFVLDHGYEAGVVFNEKAAFSIAASLALSSVFVVLTGLGFLVIVLGGVSAPGQGSDGQGFEQLLFQTILPQSLQGLLDRSHDLVNKVPSKAELYTLLGVLFLYFAVSLQLSLASNLNFLFDINRTHSMLDWRYVLGVFGKGFLLRLAGLGLGVGLSLGGYAWLHEWSPALFGHPLMCGVFATLALAYFTVVGLPLDDVPLRERAMWGLMFGPALPIGNAVFDYMFYNFQSYKLMMQEALVALLTLWLYFGWLALLFVLCTLYSIRNRRYKRNGSPGRIALCFEVLRLARNEHSFDQLLAATGVTRQALRACIDALVTRGQLLPFGSHIKPTSYTGDYQYRLPTRVDPEQVRLVLFPESTEALEASVPVEFRRRVAELITAIEQGLGDKAAPVADGRGARP